MGKVSQIVGKFTKRETKFFCGRSKLTTDFLIFFFTKVCVFFRKKYKKFRKCHHLGPRYDFFTKKISDLLLTRQSNISFQKTYGLYSLKHHTVEINVTTPDDKQQPNEDRATQLMDTDR